MNDETEAQDLSDPDFIELMRRAAGWLGISTENYIEWVIRDPDGAASALEEVLDRRDRGA